MAKAIYNAFLILQKNGKEMPIKDLKIRLVEAADFKGWDMERYEKTGYVHWESMFHLGSIMCVKAGYLIKKGGVWYLTPEGEEAIKLGPAGLLESAKKAYRKWKSEQPADPSDGAAVDSETDEATIPEKSAVDFDTYDQVAREGLERYINKKNAYEFQDLIAALLRGMGYYTPFVAPKGKDGGVDIIAYRDPLGTESPRIQVQVKHRDSAASVQEVRQLMGLLQKEGDVGIFVSTSGFTSDAKATARSSHIHIELIDLPRFISLWQEFYHRLTDEDKRLMPLVPIYFLGKKE